MFRLMAVILVFLMSDWIFFNGDLLVRQMGQWIEAGAELLADLIFSFF